MNKDMKLLVRRAVDRGCSIERRRNHLILGLPNGTRMVMSSSPSDRRAVANVRAFLKRNGVTV